MGIYKASVWMEFEQFESESTAEYSVRTDYARRKMHTTFDAKTTDKFQRYLMV